MLHLEIKIMVFTLIYFMGWFIFEKLLKRFEKGSTEKKPVRKTISQAVATEAIQPTRSVASLGTPDSTWRYIKSIKSPDWRVRRLACTQLSNKRGTAVVEALIGALDDERPEVSIAAGDALAKIGDPRAIEAITKHCENLELSFAQSYENYRAA